jgi:hypothetical protein
MERIILEVFSVSKIPQIIKETTKKLLLVQNKSLNIDWIIKSSVFSSSEKYSKQSLLKDAEYFGYVINLYE